MKWTLLAAAAAAHGQAHAASTAPEQIHIAMGADPTSELTVTWATAASAPAQVNVTGVGSFWGNTSEFGAPYNPDGLPFVHKVQLTGLAPGTAYEYTVAGSAGNNSAPITFSTQRAGSDWAPRLLFFGDMGKDGGAPSLALLTQEAPDFDFIVHVGDFAYDLDTDGGATGDAFLNRIQPMASTTPYMTCPGNHEIEDGNFSHYRERFAMPRSSINDGFDMWYSWDAGNTHFVSYSTETLFARPAEEQAAQMAWLEADLEAANAQRDDVPWVVAFAHRPFYCSNIDDDDCTKVNSKARLAFEDLFFQQGVDLVIEAHEHSAEATWPVYNGSVPDFSYDSPRAPVHIVSGSAGCNEDSGLCVNPMLGPKGEWSNFRDWLPGDYGYCRLFVHNDTALTVEMVRDRDSKVVFEADIVQESHGPFRL